MGKYAKWITHKGVRILFMNGKGLNEAENLAAQEELKQELLKDRSGPPVLVDLSKTAMSKKTADKSKEVFTATTGSGLPQGPTAIVGLNRLQKTVAQLFDKGLAQYVDNIDEGKEWLVKEDEKRRKK
jgi:hypothetical protein